MLSCVRAPHFSTYEVNQHNAVWAAWRSMLVTGSTEAA
jgi:hypothetical protein